MATVGIDFGTTNTVAAVRFRVVPYGIEDGAGVLPSVVAFPPSGVTLVGTNARRRRAIDPKNTIFSSKRLMGRGWHSTEAQEFRSRYPFDLVQRDDGLPAFKTRGGFLSATDAAALIMGNIAREVPVPLEDISAVVTVPSRFEDDARVATAEAARRAGFDSVTIVDEPVATASAYLTGTTDRPTYAAVYDLGGGTFDFAVLDCREKQFSVVAYGGDGYLGGDDIDHAIAQWAAEEVARAHRWDLRSDPVVFDRLVVACERAKRRLGIAAQSRIEMASVDPAAPHAMTYLMLDDAILQRLALDLVYRTFVICDAVLAEAGIAATDIGAVYLAGGSTQMTMVRDAVTRYFGSDPRCDHDPTEVVGLGASLMGPGEW
jgi:molecular chaperone DnaK